MFSNFLSIRFSMKLLNTISLFFLFTLLSCSDEGFRISKGAKKTVNVPMPNITIEHTLNTIDQTVEISNLDVNDEVFLIQNANSDCSTGLITSKVTATIDTISMSPSRPFSMKASDSYRVLVKKTDGTQICSDEVVTKDIFLKDVVELANTYSGMCALQSNGKVACWNGFLGLATPISTLLPTFVSNITEAKKLTGTGGGYCVIEGSNDNIKCWNNTAPTDVGLTDVKDIQGTSNGGVCAIVGSGRDLYCWGSIAGANYPTPTSMGFSDVHSLSGKDYYYCIVAGATKDLYCAGQWDTGLFGGPASSSFVQTPLSDVHKAIWSQGSTVQCVIMGSDRHVRCSGHHEYGGVGNGMTSHGYTTSYTHTTLNNIKNIFDAGFGFCAQSMDDEMSCWGWNYYATLPIPTAEKIAVPTRISELDQYHYLGGTSQVSCGLTAQGYVHCMGWDEWTRNIGKDLVKFRTTTIQNYESLSSHMDYVCHIKADKKVICQGNDRDIANGFRFSRFKTAPEEVPEFQGADKMTMGPEFQCILRTGKVYCSGKNNLGQLGNGTTVDSATLVEVLGLENKTIVDINIVQLMACALTDENKMYCWGNIERAGMGYGETSSTAVVHPLGNITAMDGGHKNDFCIIADTDQSVYCMNSGSHIKVNNSEGAKEVQVGGLGLKCLKKTDNRIYCWGSRYNGTANTVYFDATQVSALSNVGSWATLNEHTCAIASNELWCWGYNGDGVTGNGTTGFSYTPVKADLSIIPVKIEKIGISGMCAFDSAGVSQCWGLMRFDWPAGNLILAPYGSEL